MEYPNSPAEIDWPAIVEELVKGIHVLAEQALSNPDLSSMQATQVEGWMEDSALAATNILRMWRGELPFETDA